MVRKIWSEAEELGLVNKIIAGARVDAAAEIGDMFGAASVLDDMDHRSLEANILNYNSAINACKNSNASKRHDAAMFLLDALCSKNLQPSVVTFTNLVGAHRDAPLDSIIGLRKRMAALGLKANRVFAENYLGAVCGRFDKVRDAKEMAKKLREIPKQRREEARRALADFRDAAVELTRLFELVEDSLPGGQKPVLLLSL